MKKVFLVCLLTAGAALTPVTAWGQGGDIGAEDPVIPLPQSSSPPIYVGPCGGMGVLIEKLDKPALKKEKPISGRKPVCKLKSCPKAIKGQSRLEKKLIFAVPFDHVPPFGKQIFGDVTVHYYTLGNIQESLSRKTCRCALYRRYCSSKNLFFSGRTLLFQKLGQFSLADARKVIPLGNPGATFGIWSPNTVCEGVCFEGPGNTADKFNEILKKIPSISAKDPADLCTRIVQGKDIPSYEEGHLFPHRLKNRPCQSTESPYIPVSSLLLQKPGTVTLIEARKILQAAPDQDGSISG
jgi:hypothetical protein